MMSPIRRPVTLGDFCFKRHHGALLAAVGILVLMSGSTQCSAAGVGQTACPKKMGFEAWPDKDVALETGAATSQIRPEVYLSMSVAEVTCSRQTHCQAFNSAGKTFSGSSVLSLVDSEGFCTYVKGSCPPKSGYTVLNHTIPVPVGNGGPLIEYPSTDANQAEQDCAADPACPGFAVDLATGKVVRTSSGLAGYRWHHSACMYVREDRVSAACLSKYGYSSDPSAKETQRSHGNGAQARRAASRRALSSTTGGSEVRCKVTDTHCRSSAAGVISAATGAPKADVCLALRDDGNCPAKIGFTVYAGQTPSAATPPVAFDGTLESLDQTYAKCMIDVGCLGFDTGRNFWDRKPKAASEFKDAKATTCTYIRAVGF